MYECMMVRNWLFIKQAKNWLLQIKAWIFCVYSTKEKSFNGMKLVYTLVNNNPTINFILGKIYGSVWTSKVSSLLCGVCRHVSLYYLSTFFRYHPFIINDSTFLKKANDCFSVFNEKQYGFWNAFNEQQKP